MLNLLPGLNFDWRRWAAPVLMSLVLVLASQHNFLLFHTLAELFAITVAVLLAIVAWHTYSFSNNHYLMYLGVGYFWIGILDLLHTLSYSGMNLFEGIDKSTAIEFWIVTRFFEAALLLSAPLFLSRRIDRVGTMAFFALNSLFASVLIFKDHVPTMFVEGVGLTLVKVYAEYAIIGLLAVAVVITLRLRKLLDRHIVKMIVLSITFTIAAELCFTLYTSLHGVQLIAGHLFKLFSYWVIFTAIVETALKQPYEIMARTSGSYDAIPTPTLVVNRDGIIQQVNREACRVSGMQAIDLLEQDCHDVFHSRRVAKNACVVCQHITRGKALHEHEIQKPDASWWAFALSPFDAQQHSDLMVHVCSNISDRKHAEQSLIHQANYDSLTQLPNRELVMDRLKLAIARAKRENKHVAVMFIDMDNFKNINDTLGHLVGDRVLVAVSNVLKASIGPSDTLARWGGDEFIVILGELDSLSMARPVADKILRELTSPVHADNREFIISASIGISGFPDNSDNPGILLRNADAAMYLAKDAGRNTAHYYTADINAQAVARLEMEGHLRHAIEKNEMFLHYQPQASMQDKKLIGAEALLRWNNPVLGNVPPDVFIPLAESSGLIGSIGEWVLRRACEDLASWQRAGHKDLRVAVNISSLQFVSEGFIPQLKQIVEQYGISPDRLELEITESLLLGEEQRNLELLKHLRALGFSLSLDDFGTGYASISYLKKFPFNKIKIDRQFVTDADTNESDASLCQAIISMAHVLGLAIVAEGVETTGQWELLQAGNVEIAQGYLYSKPLPEAAFRIFLDREAKKGVVTTMPRRRG